MAKEPTSNRSGAGKRIESRETGDKSIGDLLADLATFGPNQGGRAGEDRKRFDEGDPEGEMDPVFASDHSPRACAVRGAEPEVRGMQAGAAVLREGQDGVTLPRELA